MYNVLSVEAIASRLSNTLLLAFTPDAEGFSPLTAARCSIGAITYMLFRINWMCWVDLLLIDQSSITSGCMTSWMSEDVVRTPAALDLTSAASGCNARIHSIPYVNSLISNSLCVNSFAYIRCMYVHAYLRLATLYSEKDAPHTTHCIWITLYNMPNWPTLSEARWKECFGDQVQ